jgi:hypothetical protein
MKPYGVVNVYCHAFFASALDVTTFVISPPLTLHVRGNSVRCLDGPQRQLYVSQSNYEYFDVKRDCYITRAHNNDLCYWSLWSKWNWWKLSKIILLLLWCLRLLVMWIFHLSQPFIFFWLLFYHLIYGCLFCMLCLIVWIMYLYCYVYVFLLLCMQYSVYSVSLCRSVYCLCVNVYSTAATGCQPNCS